MTKLTPQQIREIYIKLPGDLKNAIFSIDSANILQAIGKKYNLTVDKIGELADETGLVMLGLTHPRDFISNLSQRLGVDKETARKIAEEVNNQIFAKVRESLKKIHGVAPTPFGVGAPTSPEASVGEKKEILKEIEKADEVPLRSEASEPRQRREEIPEILKGTTEIHPFEAKTKEEIFRIPPEEKKYSSGDPYREPVE